MKIAICISGFLRTWADTKRSFLEQFTKGVDYDLFVHTYHQNLYESTAGRQDEKLSYKEILNQFTDCHLVSLIVEDREKIIDKVTEEAMQYKYVNNFGLLQQESSDKKSTAIPIGVRTFDHLRKLHLCNESRKEYEKKYNIKYDLVIKTRFDLVYFNRPFWEKIEPNPRKLYLGYGATFGWPDDTLGICSSEVMDKAYANRILLFPEIFHLSAPETFDQSLGICAHSTLRYALEKYGIEISQDRIVDISCFRSIDSFQYYGEYEKRYNMHKLYEAVINREPKSIEEAEAFKREELSKN